MNQKQRVQIAAQLGKTCSQQVDEISPEYVKLKAITALYCDEDGYMTKCPPAESPATIRLRINSHPV
jgi:hypothetical protein